MICIGMVEVSTCFIEPAWLVPERSQPRAIQRDTEIGHFEFGGSTQIMIFQKDKVKLEDWAVNATEHRQDPQPIPIGTVIATAVVA
ncbi:hypothetical protein NMY22_g15808 [Coprinellus aureogranulatus]|nr:hypothetical protein NMY22_g15808 [Coprinellus aureogranulatus]